MVKQGIRSMSADGGGVGGWGGGRVGKRIRELVLEAFRED